MVAEIGLLWAYEVAYGAYGAYEVECIGLMSAYEAVSVSMEFLCWFIRFMLGLAYSLSMGLVYVVFSGMPISL